MGITRVSLLLLSTGQKFVLIMGTSMIKEWRSLLITTIVLVLAISISARPGYDAPAAAAPKADSPAASPPADAPPAPKADGPQLHLQQMRLQLLRLLKMKPHQPLKTQVHLPVLCLIQLFNPPNTLMNQKL